MNSSVSGQIRGHIALVIAAILWATTFSFTKIGLETMEPITLAAIRASITAALLLVVITIRGELKVLGRLWKYTPVLVGTGGVLGLAIIAIAENYALQWVPSGISAVLANTIPLFTILLAAITLQERLTVTKIISVLIGFSGIFFLTFSEAELTNATLSQSAFLFGCFLLVLGAMGWAIYGLISKTLVKYASNYVVVAAGYIIAAPVLFLAAWFVDDVSVIANYGTHEWSIIVYLIASGSLAAYLLWIYGISTMEVSHSSLYLFLIPVGALLIGRFALMEQLNAQQTIGIAMVFLSIFVIEWPRKSAHSMNNINPGA